MSRAARKRARPVLRGPRRGNAPGLPDERWLAELQRRCLDRGVFCSLDELTAALEGWIKLWNASARPFGWKFTRTDLNRLLARIRQHDPFAPQPLAA